jgi:hypothetical protein
MRAVAVSLAAAALAACATKPPPPAACTTSIGVQNDSIREALARAFPDPKGHHNLVGPRVADARGDLAMEVRVWPLSGPQEPAPPHRVRVVLHACTMQLKSVVKLPD